MVFVDILLSERSSEFNEKQLLVVENVKDIEDAMGGETASVECIAWFPQRKAFISNVSQFGSSVHIQDYLAHTIEVELSADECSERFLCWHVHAQTLAMERQIITNLLTFPDATGVTSLSVTSMIDEEENEGSLDLFPCSPHQIKAIFHNNLHRELHIHSFSLDESQTIALVEEDLPLRIKLSSCEFLSRASSDDGTRSCPFNAALQRRKQPFQSLCFAKSLPFGQDPVFRQRQLQDFWDIAASNIVIDTLGLEELDVSKESGFDALSSVPLKTLAIHDCSFGNDSAGLEIIAKAIHCGCLSHGLLWDGLDCIPGDSHSWPMLTTVIANCQLCEFRLANLSANWMDRLIREVLVMVERNTKLERLCLGDIYNFSPDGWKLLMATISTHPSLQVFKVENILDGRSYHEIPQDFPEKVLKPLVHMMNANRNIDVDIPLCRYQRRFDDADNIIEKLQKFNRFSRQVDKLGQMEDQNTRFALIGIALMDCQTDSQRLSLLIAGHIDLLIPSLVSNSLSEDSNWSFNLSSSLHIS